VVVLLDTDGEAQKSESMGVLVQWPGEAAHPTRFVFLVSESRPSACAVDALESERQARSREELNGLYVALTRTQQTLVVSSMEPRTSNPMGWWQRLQGRAQDVDPLSVFADTGHASGQSAAVAQEADAPPFLLKTLPPRPVNGSVVREAVPGEAVQSATQAQGSAESRIGQAMHRLLEWLPLVPGGHLNIAVNHQNGMGTAAQCANVAREFDLDGVQVESALRMARAIAQGQGAWCWDSNAVQWQANEVPISRSGRVLRIDRLVQDRGGCWWVLDYKSSAAPQLQDDLCAQLKGYGAAVQAAYPSQMVRCAFLTPQGALIEISPS
jgi:ATP-dependent helicase/nuclease subunit A